MVNRYAVIDNPSGYVWGVVNADSPLDACNRIGRRGRRRGPHLRGVSRFSFSNESGYLCTKCLLDSIARTAKIRPRSMRYAPIRLGGTRHLYYNRLTYASPWEAVRAGDNRPSHT